MSAISERAVEIDRRIRGTPSEVFEYFVDPEKHVRWQGVRADLDPRPGGAYVIHFNERTRIRGEYVLVEPPLRLVFTWGWESEDQFPRGTRDVPAGSTTVEISFRADGDATVVHIRHSGVPTDDASGFTVLGWSAYLDRLDAITNGQPVGDDPSGAFLASLGD